MKSLDHYTRTNRLASAFIMALCLLCLTNGFSAERDGSKNSNDKPRYAKFVLERVRHVTRVKILKSNLVALRPGSVYDVITHFELLPGLRPRFIYQFLDNGLGASEPLYPLFQRGHQGSWFQVLRAAFSKQKSAYQSLHQTGTAGRMHGLFSLCSSTYYRIPSRDVSVGTPGGLSSDRRSSRILRKSKREANCTMRPTSFKHLRRRSQSYESP